MEWTSWCSSVIVISFFLHAMGHADFPTEAAKGVRCLLSQTVGDCSSLPEVTVPTYLLQAYNSTPSSVQATLRSSQLNKLSDSEIASLPLSLLYLIPRGRLTELSSAQLATILQNHSDDTSLAHQVTASIQNIQDFVNIIIKLNFSSMPLEMHQILGETINPSDIDSLFATLSDLQEPILTYIRPALLLNMDNKTISKVLSNLKEIELHKLPRKETIHIITQAAIRSNYPLTKIKWLVIGMSADEFMNRSLKFEQAAESFKLDLSNIQARAVFDRIYYNVTLQDSHMMDCQPLLTKLTPSQLLRFQPGVYGYNILLELPLPLTLPTACQIMEYVKASCKKTGKLPKNDEDKDWEHRIRYLSHWVYTLPLSVLESYRWHPLKTADLQTIETPALLPLQIYYLTGKGAALEIKDASSVLGLNASLHALPASQLVTRNVGEISSSVLAHLVATLPADNLPRTLSLLDKISSTIGESETLLSLLKNRDVNNIMSLVSPKTLLDSGSRILKIFSEKHEFAPTIQNLPQPVLAVLLDRLILNEKWTWQNLLDKSHVSQLLIGGLNCRHVEEMDSGLYIPIIALYNRQRKQAFPKNLQHCCLHKLVSHLKLKQALSQTNPSYGLISVLEPVEIESVGGFVLAALPVEALKESPYLGHILASIGKLSNAELMLAADSTQLGALAQQALGKQGSVDGFMMGNLIWQLVTNTSIPELRLMLEAGLLDTTICLPLESRRALSAHLLACFGSPEKWSAGTLVALNDLLLVFSDLELRNVSKAAWTTAADAIVSHYDDNVNWIKVMPFFQVCAETLGTAEGADYKVAVGRLVRWRLKSAQWQLNTVRPLSNTSPPKMAATVLHSDVKIESEDGPAYEFNPQEITDEEDISELTTEASYEKNQDEISNEDTTPRSVDTTTPKLVQTITSQEENTDTNPTTIITETEKPTKPTTQKSEIQWVNTSSTSNSVKSITEHVSHSEPNETTQNLPSSKQIFTTVHLIEAHTTNKPTTVTANEEELSPERVVETEELDKKEKDKHYSLIPTTAHPPNSHSVNGTNIDTQDQEEEDETYKKYSIVSNDEADETAHRRKRHIVQYENNIELSCNALRMVGKLAALVFTEADLGEMSSYEINECRVEFGAMNLSSQLQKKIWKKINRKDGLHLLGGLLSSASVADMWEVQFDFTQPWGLESIHALARNIKNPPVLEKLMKNIQDANSNFPSELLTVLGNHTCTLDPEKLPSKFTVGLEPWDFCPTCLPRLAQLAVKELGSPANWTQHHVHTLHAIVAGLELEDWKALAASPHKPLTALQSSAVACLNNSHLQALSPDHIKQIPTLSLHAVSEQQLLVLYNPQLQALRNVTQLIVPEKLTASESKVINIAGVPSFIPSTASSHRINFALFSNILPVVFLYMFSCAVNRFVV